MRHVLIAAAMAFMVMPAPLQAQEPACAPYPETRAAERSRLFAALKVAPSQMAADALTDRIWRFWLEAPDAEASAMMAAALEAVQAGDAADALAMLDALIAYCPGYPEAWNQRATLYYRLGRFDESLADVAETLAREPKHFGALAGKAAILMQQGQTVLGQIALREALAIHPFLRERRMLRDTGQEL